MDGRSVAAGAWSSPLTASPFSGPEQFLLLDHALDLDRLGHHDRLFDHDLLAAAAGSLAPLTVPSLQPLPGSLAPLTAPSLQPLPWSVA